MLTLEQLLAYDNLQAAWEKVASNHGAAGSDGVAISTFRHHLEQELADIRYRLEANQYHPSPLRLVEIPKKSGGMRTLAIPSVADRVLQTALTRLWSPFLEKEFCDTSFGYRPGRSVSQAIEQIIQLRDDGYLWVVDADIEQFFCNIPHQPLLQLASRYLPVPQIQTLLQCWLRGEMADSEGYWCAIKGIAMGSPISPLLANLYLHHLDMTLEQGCFKLIRYADDFLILCKHQRQAEQALELTDKTLEALALNLNPDKTRISHFDNGFEFLGYQFVRTLQVKSSLGVEPQLQQRTASALQSAFNTLYLSKQGAVINLEGNRIVVRLDGQVIEEVPALRLQLIAIFGRLHISTPLMGYCLKRDIRVVFLSRAGYYQGMLDQCPNDNLPLLRLQLDLYENPEARRQLARELVRAKLRNSLVLLKRYQRSHSHLDYSKAIETLRKIQPKLRHSNSIPELLGYEGATAHAYFRCWQGLLTGWTFPGRKQHPSPDPINALLSFGYTLLFQNTHALIKARGLNPMIGSLHELKQGHAALASDLMEQFRIPIVDQLVLRLLTRGQIIPDEFEQQGEQCRLTDESRKFFLIAFEKRMQTIIKHPRTGRSMSYRRSIEQQIDHYIDVLHHPGMAYPAFEIR